MSGRIEGLPNGGPAADRSAIAAALPRSERLALYFGAGRRSRRSRGEVGSGRKQVKRVVTWARGELRGDRVEVRGQFSPLVSSLYSLYSPLDLFSTLSVIQMGGAMSDVRGQAVGVEAPGSQARVTDAPNPPEDRPEPVRPTLPGPVTPCASPPTSPAVSLVWERMSSAPQ
jgi:hypothetical protein